MMWSFFGDRAELLRKTVLLIWAETRHHEQTGQAMPSALSVERDDRHRLQSFLDVHTGRR